MHAKNLCEKLGGVYLGVDDYFLNGIKPLKLASKDDLSVVRMPGDSLQALKTKASCLLVSKDFAANFAHQLDKALIAVENIDFALAKALQYLCPQEGPKISSTCNADNIQISDKANIGDNTNFADFCFVGDYVEIGDNCQFGPGCKILPFSKIGHNTKLGANCNIGNDGFALYVNNDNNEMMPHHGNVEIGNNVRLGAGVCVDKSIFGSTKIGNNTKIDNLVQIGHGAQIGNNVLIAAQVGIAGNVIVEDNCVIAGQAGIAHNITLGENTLVNGQAGVHKSTKKGEIVSGSPAMSHKNFLLASYYMKYFKKYVRKIQYLEKIIKKG